MFKILYVDFPEQMSDITKIILHSKQIVLINNMIKKHDTVIIPFSSIIQ